MTNRWIRIGLVCCVAAGLLLIGWSAVRSQRQAPDRPVPKLSVLQAAQKPRAAPVQEMSTVSAPGTMPAPTAAELNGSMKVRRDYAWATVQRVWEPVKVPGGEIPTWMTWYEEEDIAELYKEVVAKDMAGPQSKPLTITERKASVAALLKRHNSKDLQASLTSARLGKVLRQFSFSQVHNLGPNRKPGTGAIYYSPAYVKHLLENAASIAICDPSAPPRHTASNLYAQCMEDEMPQDAVMIKTAWAQSNESFAYIDAGAPQIATGLQLTPTGMWVHVSAQPTSYCCGPGLFTIKDENGKTWGLLGMHIASKQLRTWMWTSVFWQNFGWDWATDQPAALRNKWDIGGYGMCTVTDFKESDPAPWSAYDGMGGNNATLPKAIKAVYQVMNGVQWCANPFIEPDMSRGNCVGCHQGSPSSALPTTLTKDRQTNPSDFSFSFDTNRANIIQIRKAYALTHKVQQKP